MTRKVQPPDRGERARAYAHAGSDSIRRYAPRRGETDGTKGAGARTTIQHGGVGDLGHWWRERLQHVLGVRAAHIRVDVDRDSVYLSGHLPRTLVLALRAAIDASGQGDRVHNLVETELWSN